MVYILLDLIRGLYPIRTCTFDLSEEKVAAQKYKVCLEFHLGNCFAPCENKMTEQQYNQNIKAIRSILKGNFRDSLQDFKSQMGKHALKMEFEDAQKIKEKLEILENYQSKSTIVNPKISNVDVFSIITDEQYGYVNFLQLSYGSIIRSHTREIKKKLDETPEKILTLAVIEIRQRFNSQSSEIYLPFDLNFGSKIKVTVPQLGDKKKILDLSERNAKYFRMERFKQIQIVDPERHTDRLMSQMKQDLRLSFEPRHIECFDNSNLQGSNPVAACVVFKNGKPAKKEYRHYNIKTVEGPDDFASMEEVVFRRYKRLLNENQPLPSWL
jgi:excinuclease ABC subunit C